MQLGELQGQLERFDQRGATIVALSVDPLKQSKSLIKRLKLTMKVVSDENQKIMQAYGVQNPDTEELALHAVYIVDKNRQIFYRKVAGRRPRSQELLDALDYHGGRYPLKDNVLIADDLEVAYPVNIFQTLIELSTVNNLPEGMASKSFDTIITLLKNGESDEVIIALRKTYASLSVSFSRRDLLASAVWITNSGLGTEELALATGGQLKASLIKVRNLRSQQILNLAAIQQEQKHLDELRTLIRDNASRWNLRYAKSMLRGFRELAIAVAED